MAEQQIARRDYYLSDDREAELRRAAPLTCRHCQKYAVKDSFILGTPPIETCGAVDLTAPNGPILSSIMLRLAMQGSCPEREGFFVSPRNKV